MTLRQKPIWLAISFALSTLFCTAKQFSYEHKTEIAYNNEPGFALDQKINTLAYDVNKHLNSALFFNTAFISDLEKTRAYQVKSKPHAAHIGQTGTVVTTDGVTIRCTYFDRNSDTLLIVGGGFTNARELMSPFVDMFPDYDVVIFDYRGHGYIPFEFLDRATWPNVSKKLLDVDTSMVRFGVDEDKDVMAVVNGCKKFKQKRDGKPYSNVYGLGLCYSAFIFTKTLALNPGAFDKLVLDGCWLSLPLFVDKIKNDLKTLADPQSGGWSDHWLFSKQYVKNCVEFMAVNIFGVQLSDISLLDYLGKIKDTPMLFFYGKDDYMVHRHEFEQLWNALQTAEKTVIITSNQHVRNHLKEKELYKLSCDLFFQLSHMDFIDCLKDSKKLVNHHVNALIKRESELYNMENAFESAT